MFRKKIDKEYDKGFNEGLLAVIKAIEGFHGTKKEKSDWKKMMKPVYEMLKK